VVKQLAQKPRQKYQDLYLAINSVKMLKKLATAFIVSSVVFLACRNAKTNNEIMTTQTYSIQNILSELDESTFPNPYKSFFYLENKDVERIGSRLLLYANDTSWAIVFENSIYDSRAYHVSIERTYFGNCLKNMDLYTENKYEVNTYFSLLITEDQVLSISDDNNLLYNTITEIPFRDTMLPVIRNKEEYLKHKIAFNSIDSSSQNLNLVALLRLLKTKNPNLFHAKNEEIYEHLPNNLNLILALDKWHHKDYINYNNNLFGKKPSQQETYKQLAKVLVTKDTTNYAPSLQPNTDQ
jgi:hypothetical protein